MAHTEKIRSILNMAKPSFEQVIQHLKRKSELMIMTNVKLSADNGNKLRCSDNRKTVLKFCPAKMSS